MDRDPLRTAWFRFEQISPLLDTGLAASERRRLMETMSTVPVVWPSGRIAPVPVSTLYRWLKNYQQEPRIEVLFPKSRARKATSSAILEQWAQYALALLEEEPERSLFILAHRLKDHFGLKKLPGRSSLYRALRKDPRYRKLRMRAHGERKLRRRFQARRPHDIWHADAKADFTIRFVGGKKVKVRILSILDDCTRFVLRALIVPSESTRAVVKVFRQAAARYGLPIKFYADRGSAYDSWIFRKGLAILGVHRINTKPGNPSAHGKIEAYHRSLQRWFVIELRHQPVRDLAHLQVLLDAFIDQLYHEHVHRELKMTPKEAFGECLSKRLVSLERIREAFLVEKLLSPHKKDGTIRVNERLFLVPRRLVLGAEKRKIKIFIDPEYPQTPYIRLPHGGIEELKPAFKTAGTSKPKPPENHQEEPVGSLTPLLERYRGRKLPQANPGFGLPEIYQAFSEAMGRPVPLTEDEAVLILDWLKHFGPFDPKVFRSTLALVLKRLGRGRPLAQIVSALKKITDQLMAKKEIL